MADVDIERSLQHLIHAAEARTSMQPASGRGLKIGQDATPVLVAVGGLAGTGKSTLARGLAPLIGRGPGALHVRSDEIRKMLAGVDPLDRLPSGSYTPEASRQVYACVGAVTRAALGAGWSVVVDTVAAGPSERAAFADFASECGARFIGLWLEAPEATRIARVTARRNDASDADAAVVATQSRYDTGNIDWIRIDAGGSAAETIAAARSALEV